MIEDIFADVPKEGENPFKDMEKETPPESQPEKEPKADKPEEGDNTPDEKNLPFHEHPRWKEREKELKELRERDETTAKELADLKAFKEKTEKTFAPQETKIPDWFRELYGDNEIAYQKYQEHEQSKEQEIEQRILAKQQEEVQKTAQETAKWSKWVEDNITKLEEDGAKFDRNKLIKTMLDYRPTDEAGNFDFQKGYKIYEALNPEEKPDIEARKKIADTSISKKGESPKKDYMTSAELRRQSWQSL